MFSPSQPGFEEGFAHRSSNLSIASAQQQRQRASSQSSASSNKEHRRTISSASSVVSVQGTSENGDLAGKNTIIPAEYSRNAISTLLRPPIVRTGLRSTSQTPDSGFKAPTTRDIPPVTLTNIPRIDGKSFQVYLSQIGSIYESFKKTKAEEFPVIPPSTPRNGIGSDNGVDSGLIRSPPRTPNLSRIDSISTVGSQTIEVQDFSSSTSPRLRRLHELTPLSTIPNIYFEEPFHLENPRTFDVVSERSEVVRDPSHDASTGRGGRKALATNAILQEKLSWYMDTVEMHLISSISKASTSFFSALGYLQELHAEADSSVRQIRSLRKDLAQMDSQMVTGGMKVVKLKQRRQNTRRLAEAVAQLRAIVEAVTRCEETIQHGDVDTALDQLDSIEDLMAGRQNIDTESATDGRARRDLRGIRALEGAADDLAQLRARVGKAYETKFLASLLDDLRNHVGKVPPRDTLLRWGTAFSRSRARDRQSPAVPAYINIDAELRNRLRSNLTGLARANHTMLAAAAFKSSTAREMKSIIRRNMPSSVVDDDDNESVMSASTHGGRQQTSQEKSSVLARNLRAMDGKDAQTTLTNIYTAISESLRRLSMQVKILLDITSDLSNPANDPRNGSVSSHSTPSKVPKITLQEDMSPILDMSSSLGEVVDMVQGQIIKVIKVRSEQTSHLPLDAFLRYFTLNRLFADECEAISGRGGTALKGVVDSQIQDFIAQLGNSQKHTIVETMDADKWDAQDFGDAETSILSRVVDGGTRDVQAWYRTSMIWTDSDQQAVNGGINGSEAPIDGNTSSSSPLPAKEKIRSAVVGDHKFILPASAMTILRAMESFQHLTVCIPSRSSEIESNLIDCLKLFNSRLSQLILGAGATRSAGLKNITTKHLALGAQALSFVATLIPFLSDFFRRHSSGSSSAAAAAASSSSSAPANAVGPTLTSDFDKVRRLLQDHQSAIYEKLVDIMSSRASVHVNSMKRINWQERVSPASSTPVSAYMETLTKETATLQKVLSKHLPEDTVTAIMRPVFDSYRDQLSAAFAGVAVESSAAKERYVNFFSFSLSLLAHLVRCASIFSPFPALNLPVPIKVVSRCYSHC